MTVVYIHKTDGLSIPDGFPLRIPSRPVEYRLQAAYQDTFENEFDYKTLFYDYYLDDFSNLHLFSPPLLNLEEACMHLVKVKVDDVFYDFSKIKWLKLDRFSHGVIESVKNECIFAFSNFDFNIDISRGGELGIFSGKKVLLTKNKDNEIDWILDWIKYNKKSIGIDAILLYDNSSTLYSVDLLRERILEQGLLDVCVIVPWPYKFGPKGVSGKYFDSDYTQYGILEHAKNKYLSNSKFIVSIDVDELVVPDDCKFNCDDSLIAAYLDSSPSNIISLNGFWVENFRDESALPQMPHHSDFFFTENPARECGSKWIIKPSACNELAQWKVHVVDGFYSNNVISIPALKHFVGVTKQVYRGGQNKPVTSYLKSELLVKLFEC